jgi:hypothetical protein
LPAGLKEKVHARHLASPASRLNRGSTTNRAHTSSRPLQICHRRGL